MKCPECDGLGVVFYRRPAWIEGGWHTQDLGDDVFDADCPTCRNQKDDRAGVEPDAA